VATTLAAAAAPCCSARSNPTSRGRTQRQGKTRTRVSRSARRPTLYRRGVVVGVSGATTLPPLTFKRHEA
jgi:hypothetical protein